MTVTKSGIRTPPCDSHFFIRIYQESLMYILYIAALFIGTYELIALFDHVAAAFRAFFL